MLDAENMHMKVGGKESGTRNHADITDLRRNVRGNLEMKKITASLTNSV